MDGVPDRQKLCAGKLSHFRVFATPWTVAHQAPLSMGFSRQEYWSRLAHPTPGDLPNPRIKLASPESPALAGGFFTTVQPGQVKVKLIQSCLILFVTTWTVAHQVPVSMGILQARILEWDAMPSSRESSQPRDGTQVSHIAGRFFTI